MEKGSMNGPANPPALLDLHQECRAAVPSRAAPSEPAPELTTVVAALKRRRSIYVRSRFVLFCLVGASGLVVNLAVLRVLLVFAGAGFVGAQSLATATAMVWNYFLNNSFTYREYRLVGWKALRGLASFMAVCGLGAVVNVLVARDLYYLTGSWLLAGTSGAMVGALFNYALTSMFTWGRRFS
jgi:putative flippase GtrA